MFSISSKHTKRISKNVNSDTRECDGSNIYSNISNGTIDEDLKRIFDHYLLGLKIEEGKPE